MDNARSDDRPAIASLRLEPVKEMRPSEELQPLAKFGRGEWPTGSPRPPIARKSALSRDYPNEEADHLAYDSDPWQICIILC